jgi:hypothetical protein
MARQRHYRLSARCCHVPRVSPGRAARPGPHTRGKPRLLDVGRRFPREAGSHVTLRWRRQSRANPSLKPNSLLCGKIQRIFTDRGLRRRSRLRFWLYCQIDRQQFPTSLTGNLFRLNSELNQAIRETFGLIRERAVASCCCLHLLAARSQISRRLLRGFASPYHARPPESSYWSDMGPLQKLKAAVLFSLLYL